MANPFREAMGGAQAPRAGRRNLAPSLLQHIQNFQGNPMEQLQSKQIGRASCRDRVWMFV